MQFINKYTSYIYICVWIHMVCTRYIYTSVCIYVSICVCMYMYVYVCVCQYAYENMCICLRNLSSLKLNLKSIRYYIFLCIFLFFSHHPLISMFIFGAWVSVHPGLPCPPAIFGIFNFCESIVTVE